MSKKLLMVFLSLSSISLYAADADALRHSTGRDVAVKKDPDFNKTSSTDGFDALDPLKERNEEALTDADKEKRKEQWIAAIKGMGC